MSIVVATWLRVVRTFPLLAAVGAFALCGTAQAQGKINPRVPDFTGVWMGMARQEAPAAYVNTPFPYPPPFTAQGEIESRHWADPINNLGLRCIPGGGPVAVMNATSYFPIEIIQKPLQFTIISEYLEQIRRVFLDGRKHPADLEHTWMGHSVGRWEGDVLVIDTVGLHAGPLNGSGATVNVLATDKDPRMPYSPQLHLTERLKMLQGGQYLEDELTIDDPAIYQQPYKLKRYWRRAPELDMLEYICTENMRPEDQRIIPATALPATPKP